MEVCACEGPRLENLTLDLERGEPVCVGIRPFDSEKYLVFLSLFFEREDCLPATWESSVSPQRLPLGSYVRAGRALCLHVWVYTHVRLCMLACENACMCVCACVHMCACVYVCAHAHSPLDSKPHENGDYV